MEIIKLSSSHCHSIRPIFISDDSFDSDIDKLVYNTFCDTYLSDLENFHAYGAIDDLNVVHAFISFYESDEEPSWYCTSYRNSGNNQLLKDVLDKTISYNEEKGRLKFYTLVDSKYSKVLRRIAWSKYNSTRYGYFDEYMVPEKCKTFYNTHWELLYKRILIPTDTTVRCNFLKQEYRTMKIIGGSI